MLEIAVDGACHRPCPLLVWEPVALRREQSIWAPFLTFASSSYLWHIILPCDCHDGCNRCATYVKREQYVWLHSHYTRCAHTSGCSWQRVDHVFDKGVDRAIQVEQTDPEGCQVSRSVICPGIMVVHKSIYVRGKLLAAHTTIF